MAKRSRTTSNGQRTTIFALLLAATAALAADPPYASKTPIPEPRLFAPGEISTGDFESHPAFTPDGRTLYFLKDAPNFAFWTICVSRFANGKWSSPEVAPFSGQYRDADPFITADGARFYFISDRPTTPGGAANESLDVWYMNRRGDAWSDPIHLPPPVNSPGDEWFPNAAADGTLWFGSDREGGLGRTDIYRCPLLADGTYGPAQNLGAAINSKADEFEPLVAPDQSFVIFMASGGRPGGKGAGDLWISRFRDGAWTPARNLEELNSPALEIGARLSPDGRYLLYSSSRSTTFTGAPMPKRLTTSELTKALHSPGNGLGDIYIVDISAIRE